MQPLFARCPHDDLQLLDVAADGIDRIIFRREPCHKIVVEFQIDIAEIESLSLCFAELVELNDKPFVVLDCRCPVAQFVDVQSGAVLHLVREAGDVVAERFAAADMATGGEAARVVETVDDLLQPRFRHRVFGILGDLSEDVASQFGEILGQLAPLLLGEVVGKGETALDCLPFVVPGVRQHHILAVGVELVTTANCEENLDFDQFVFLGRADAVAEGCHRSGGFVYCKCNHFCHTFVIHRPNFRKLPDLAVDEKWM